MTEPAAPTRDAQGRFRKGASGNPGGRCRSHEEIRQLARQHGPAAIQQLARLAKHARAEAVRVKACEALLDRGFGRIPVAVQGSSSAGPLVVVVSSDDLNL